MMSKDLDSIPNSAPNNVASKVEWVMDTKLARLRDAIFCAPLITYHPYF